MVNTRRTQRFEPTIRNQRGSSTQKEESQYSHEEMEVSQEDLSRGGSQENRTRMDRLERFMENMLTLMQGMQSSGQIVPRVPDAIDRFQRLNPPIFRGEANADPIKSEYWLEHLEKIFDVIGCSEEEKIVCATLMLRDEADHWWRTMQRTLPSPTRQGMPAITWAQFKEIFDTKYFPLCKKMEKGREFMNLRQAGNMSVTQYEYNFTRLVKYMPIYNLDEEAKAQKFLSGLKLEIQVALCSLETCTYAEVVFQALTVESNFLRISALEAELQEFEDKNMGKKHNLTIRGGKFKSKGKCLRCQKFHPGKPYQSRNQGCYSWEKSDHMSRDCPKGPKCFNCQKIGHLLKDCPQKKKANQSGANKRGQEPRWGRVYHLTREDASASPSVIQGKRVA